MKSVKKFAVRLLRITVVIIASYLTIILILKIISYVDKDLHLSIVETFTSIVTNITIVASTINDYIYEIGLLIAGRFTANFKHNLKEIFKGVVLVSTLFINVRRYKSLKTDKES